MSLHSSQSISWFLIQCVFVLLISVMKIAIAQPLGTTGKTKVNLVMAGDKGNGVQLDIKQMPMAQVLGTIAKQVHIPIHYSGLPEGLVTATCVRATLKEALECVLDRKADLIVRYSNDGVKVGGVGQISEAWVLGSQLGNSVTSSAEYVTKSTDDETLTHKQKQKETESTGNADSLLEMAQSTSAKERANAIGALLAVGRKGDPAIKAALEQAVTDQNADVRAQAISTLAHREGSGAIDAIRDALQDSSAEVRMMAVDGITDDVALLQQAVNDSDETIRMLAEFKLQELIPKQ